MDRGGNSEEVQFALADLQLSERVTAIALLAFSHDELELMSAEQSAILKVLLKRRLLKDSTEPSTADALRIRQQFEDYCDRRFGDAAALRLAAQLR